MAVTVSTNLTKVTISTAGVQGPKGENGASGSFDDVSIFATTASLNEFTSSIQSEVNSIKAWTASLELINTIDTELLQLYQTTASLNQFTASAATLGSNTFSGNQTINGSIILDNGSTIKDNENESISFGVDAASSGQGVQSVALGSGAGQTSQANGAVAIGGVAGNLEQGQAAVAIGLSAGTSQQGDYAIAIGNLAGSTTQAANSIVITALEDGLENTTANSLKVAPIRNTTGTDGLLQYNNTTKEVSYSNEFTGSLNITGSVTIANADNAWNFREDGVLKLNNGFAEIYADVDDYSVRIGNAPTNVAPNAQIILGGGQVFRITAGPPLRQWDFVGNGDFNLTGSINGARNLATTGSNTFVGNQTISGSLLVSGSSTFTNIGPAKFSGSLAATGSIDLSGSVVINQLTYPTLNFADGQYGVEVPTLGTNNVFTMEVPKTIYEYVKNDSGVFLPKGTPVHSTGTVGFNSLVVAASASKAETMPATYILAQDLASEAEGLGIAIGVIQGVNTTGLVAGQPVWVGANGGWTQTKPTGSNLIQNLGIVTKVGSNGGGVVLGAGRSNDVPNIQQGYFWVGNSGSVATAFPTASFAVTASANTFYGNQTITGSLHISGSGSLNGNNIVSSNTIMKIETISSASYAALNPPVSGTLYIII